MSWISAIAQAAGSVANGIQGASAAHNAAGEEASYSKQAQQLEATNQNNANAAQATALGNVTTAESPYTTEGSTAAGGLNTLLSNGFTAPTLQQAENTPGYQFELQSGTNAINANAAATGNLMSGTTGTALEQYGQNLASTNYQQAYNNALNSYMANYQSLLGGANLGQSATNTVAGANLQTASNTANIDLTSGAEQAQQLNNQGNAYAGGDLGASAAWSGMIGGLENAAGNTNWGGGGGGGGIGGNSAGSQTPGGVPQYGS